LVIPVLKWITTFISVRAAVIVLVGSLLLSSDIKSRRSSTLWRFWFGRGGVNSDAGVGGVGVADFAFFSRRSLVLERSSSLLHNFKRESSVETIAYTSRSSQAESRLTKYFCDVCISLLLNYDDISHNFHVSPRTQGITRLAVTDSSPCTISVTNRISFRISHTSPEGSL